MRELCTRWYNGKPAHVQKVAIVAHVRKYFAQRQPSALKPSEHQSKHINKSKDSENLSIIA